MFGNPCFFFDYVSFVILMFSISQAHTHTEIQTLCPEIQTGIACAAGGGPHGAGTKACNASQELIKLGSMDWFKGKLTGTPHIKWENLWFPVDFPFNQFIDWGYQCHQ